MSWLNDVLLIVTASGLVLLNGFFVAAEFALVKVREGQVTDLVRQGRPFARTARWLLERLEGALSACQLGITMASLGLGWIGEPAFARLLQPAFHAVGIRSSVALHTLAFLVAFTAITSLHLVIGEQAPKIFAIRRADRVLLWCAVPLKWFYLTTYPLMAALNATTDLLLANLGLTQPGHGAPHSEPELRALIREAHVLGELTGSEHQLINAVFEFDDMVCRRIMVPRSEVECFDINHPVTDCLAQARRSKHTRYPVVNGSLDEVLGVVHVKDLVGLVVDDTFDWKSIMRPPRKVPENMPISKLLRHFQATHQLLAFVVDEYGIVIGIVTLENVLEQIIGDVDDEFDSRRYDIVPQGPDEWLIRGSTPVDEVSQLLRIHWDDADVDTFSGLLTSTAERLLQAGDRVPLGEFVAEVLETRGDRAEKILVTRAAPPQTSAH